MMEGIDYMRASYNSNYNSIEFRKEYENLQPEFDVIRDIVKARNSQNLT